MQQMLAVNTGANERSMDAIRQVIAGGSSSNMRAKGFVIPIVVRRASGARIWDMNGAELIDVNMGYGPHLFGYADPQYTEDIAAQLRDGAMTGLPHRLDLEAGELIAQLVPSMEQVRFANSGTEALMSAVRLARMSTERTLIVTFAGHYHGWSDTLLRRPVIPGALPASLDPGCEPGAPGMLPETLSHTIQIPWNDPDSLRAVFARHGERIAAVVCEPVLANAGVVPPAPGLLAMAREMSAAHGAFLIFDEVITGFRVARGGAQALYGVTPDLTVLSKVLGGGFPVSAFGGTRATMAPLARNEAFHAGVYAGNHAAMAAVVSMLRRISSSSDIYDKLDALGAYAESEVRKVFAAAGLPVWIGRAGSLMSVSLSTRRLRPEQETAEGPAATDFVLHRELQARCQRGGVYFHPNPFEPWFLSTSHTIEDINTVCGVIKDALLEIEDL